MLLRKSFQQKFLFGSAGQRGDEETFVPAPALDPLFCCKSSWLQSTEHRQAPDNRNSRHSCETLSETSWDLMERLVMSPLNHQRSTVSLLFLSRLTPLSEGEASLGDNKLICLFTFWSCTCDALLSSLVRLLSPSLFPLSSSLPLRSYSVWVSPLPSVLIGVYTHVWVQACLCVWQYRLASGRARHTRRLKARLPTAAEQKGTILMI